ncbi:hypothetical protein KJ605_01290 [Patescibacteria group bacterium]|nr:hypothetical protein [Patescibacteria group bacterium]MBU1970393.1 hypothetical protein [Patescibacteria group bacterium]
MRDTKIKEAERSTTSLTGTFLPFTFRRRMMEALKTVVLTIGALGGLVYLVGWLFLLATGIWRPFEATPDKENSA